jgi:hypothetical protein
VILICVEVGSTWNLYSAICTFVLYYDHHLNHDSLIVCETCDQVIYPDLCCVTDVDFEEGSPNHDSWSVGGHVGLMRRLNHDYDFWRGDQVVESHAQHGQLLFV